MKVKLNVILIVIVVVIVAFNVYMGMLGNNVVIVWNNTTTTTTTTTYMPTNVTYECETDADCAWTSTNCCTENAGANWECVNKESYVNCQSNQVLCPQVISPRPSQVCSCISGRCS
jgi:hypothetical protein